MFWLKIYKIKIRKNCIQTVQYCWQIVLHRYGVGNSETTLYTRVVQINKSTVDKEREVSHWPRKK